MIYAFFAASLIINGLLIWYIRKLLTKYWYDIEARNSFTDLLSQYSETLAELSKIEELYGDENIKKAVEETSFVIEACKNFKEILKQESVEDAEEATGEEDQGREAKGGPIYLKEGEKVTQDAGNYRRVVPAGR